MSVLAVMLACATGCSSQSEPAATSSQASPSTTESPTAPAPAGVASQIDARWIGLETGQPPQWDESDRQVTRDFQQFSVRPVDETHAEFLRGCNGCGEKPPTEFVTAYASGKFDPADARKGQPVTVNGVEGFFRQSDGTEDGMLAWPYADNAWATVSGRSKATMELDPLVKLASSVRPTERTPIRLPLSLAHLPATMPLASIQNQHDPYPTIVRFDACPVAGYQAPVPECAHTTDTLEILIWPTDRYFGHFSEEGAVPMTIGGKQGLLSKNRHEAAVQITPDRLVVFELSAPFKIPAEKNPRPPATNFDDILAGVEWAPDPGNEATWHPVSDWAKQ
jgi:hypothetical protein